MSSLPTIVVRFVFPVAIPSGHRVEVTWYAETTTDKSLFGKVTESRKVVGTAIRDLDTQVLYGPGEVFGSYSSIQVGTPLPLPAEPRAELAVTRRLRGRLERSAIAYVSSEQTQTTLVLTVDEDVQQ